MFNMLSDHDHHHEENTVGEMMAMVIGFALAVTSIVQGLEMIADFAGNTAQGVEMADGQEVAPKASPEVAQDLGRGIG